MDNHISEELPELIPRVHPAEGDLFSVERQKKDELEMVWNERPWSNADTLPVFTRRNLRKITKNFTKFSRRLDRDSNSA
jgi:hypothetical protein